MENVLTTSQIPISPIGLSQHFDLRRAVVCSTRMVMYSIQYILQLRKPTTPFSGNVVHYSWISLHPTSTQTTAP